MTNDAVFNVLIDHWYILLWQSVFSNLLPINFPEKEGGRGKEGERNTDVKEKHQAAASHTQPNWGSNLRPEYVP